MLKRILINTRKHLARSGWIGFASVFVMTLAFLVASTFGILAFFANLQIQFIEQKSNMLVFFNVGMDQEIIDRLKSKWGADERISEINYLSEEEAFEFYSQYTARAVPEQFQVLSRLENKKLPSSLEIKLKSLDDIDSLEALFQADIDVENESLVLVDIETQEQSESATETSETDEPEGTILPDSLPEATTFNESIEQVRYKYSDEVNEPPINLVVDSENLNIQKDFFFKARVVGLVSISVLLLFVTIFIFMTVEFRLYNQKEEIGVMQLVGGSLFFIRSPYILEGGIYGLLGSLISSGIIGGLLSLIFVFKIDEQTYNYLIDDIAVLPWPYITSLGWALIVGALACAGFLLGAVSSYLSIRRYIR